jgi:hypothetical protein
MPQGQRSAGKGGSPNSQYAYPITKSLPVGRTDMGVDWCASTTSTAMSGYGDMFAIGDGQIVHAGYVSGWPGQAGILLKLDQEPTGYTPSSQYIYYYEHVSPSVHDGQRVTAGQRIGSFNCIEVGWATSSGAALAYGHYTEGEETAEGKSFRQFVDDIQNNSVQQGGGGSGGVGGGSDTAAIAKATAFATFLNVPGLFDQAESLALRGERSLMNDQPLLPFVEQLTQASLRNFQSMPNGNFFAFYPDYFGGLNHRTPYWEIHDIEILDGQINLSDDALATHVYVVGDTTNFDGVNIIDKIQSAGVVTVFNAFMADFLNGIDSPLLQQKTKDKKAEKLAQKDYEDKIKSIPTLADKDKAIAFLQKYGARPYYQEMPMVRSPYYELFLAYQVFCLMWSKQFLTRFEFTFMPELFPGGIVSFPEHGIQCYVDEVTHQCSYTEGFTTQANLSAPAALKNASGKADESRAWVNQGMVRAGIMAPDNNKPAHKPHRHGGGAS